MNLKGKVAVVTGGGRGIGKSIAVTLAKAGADIVVTDIDQAIADETAKELEGLGVKAMAITFNVAKTSEVEESFKAVYTQMGKIDILVNNAGMNWDGVSWGAFSWWLKADSAGCPMIPAMTSGGMATSANWNTA